MEFRILGPLQVLDGRREVALGSPKERALLAVLLLHAGAVVSRERLIEELWGEAPPPTAAKALNVHVSKLRKALACNGHDVIATRPPGYALEVEPAQLDAARFERMLAAARAHVESGDAESAARLLRDALALWRGPALDGVEVESAARNEARRLEELRIAAQMDRIDCDLALGLHEQLIGELEALASEHPLRERVYGQLILALYRSERQADALRTYREARKALVGELGIEPSLPLQRLEKAILNQDPSLEAPAGVARAERPPAARAAGRRASLRARLPSRVGASLSRRRIAVLVAIALGTAATLSTFVLTSHRASAPEAGLLPPHSLGLIDPATNRILGVARLGPSPRHVAVGTDAVWVLKSEEHIVLKVSPKTEAVVDSLGIDDPPTAAAPLGSDLWVLTNRATLRRVDAGTGTVLQTISLEGNRAPTGAVSRRPPQLAVGAGSLWVSSQRTVWRINPTTGRVVARILLDEEVNAIAFGEGAVWIVGVNPETADYVLSEISPRTDSLVQTNNGLHSEPLGVAAGEGGVWVSEHWDDRLWRFDPTTGRVEAIIETGDGPWSVAVGNGDIWVANRHDNTLSRINPETNERVATLATGSGPIELAVGKEGIWVATSFRHLD